MGLMKWLRRTPSEPPMQKVMVAPAGWYGGGDVPSSYLAYNGVRSMGKAYADVHFVYEVVSRISSAASTLPIKVMELGPGGVHLEATDHPASRLLRKPSATVPRALLISSTVGDLCLHGNAFWLKVRSQTEVPAELWRLRPERMRAVPDPDSGRLLGWVYTVGNKEQPYLPEDIVHFRNYNPLDDLLGISPLTAMRYQVELGRDAESAAVDFWVQGARLNGVLESPLPMTDEAIERLSAQFKALAGKGGRYRTPILEEGITYKATALSPKDAEFIETAQITRRRFANAYGYPLSDDYSARATPDEIRKGLYADAVQVWTVLMEETMELQLMPDFPGEAFPQFQMRHILDPNIAERYGAYKEGIYGGWLPPEYVKRLEDIPPTAGPTYIPMNMVMVGPDGKPIPTAQPQPDKDSTGGMGGDNDQDGPSTGSGNAKGAPKSLSPKDFWRALLNGYETTSSPATSS